MKKNSIQAEIEQFIKANPGVTLTELTAHFDDNRNAMASRLRSLVQYGRAQKIGSPWDGFKYFPAPEAAAITPRDILSRLWLPGHLNLRAAA